MLVFETVRYKNFMSTGNQFIEIYLNKYDKTLVTGKNGHGKSTIYHALYWGLFGKTFDSSLKIGQVINSINNKNAVVEVEFGIGVTKYKVVRGMKPSKFEIYIDGVLKKQDATVRDYQKFLDNNVLKMSSNTFQQIVILGSKQYTPFMRLAAKERRSVVEDLLDIQYFSVMSNLIKKQTSEIKETYTNILNDIRQLDTTIELTQIKIDELNNHNDDVIESNKEEILSLNENITSLVSSKDANESKIVDIDGDKLNRELESIRNKSVEIKNYKLQINTNKDNTERKLSFFGDNVECPTCEQDIDSKYKSSILEMYNDKLEEYNSGITKANKLLNDIDTTTLNLEQEIGDLIKWVKNIKHIDLQIEHLNKSIDTLESQNKKLAESVDTSVDEKEIKSMRKDLKKLNADKLEITEQVRYSATIVELLKDGGIKTRIVEQYVPVINNLIKKYLNILEFNIGFVLDNEFNETIKSRGRDVFSYGNFSDGQKIRIDLALLFTFREVSKLKNSAYTNLLIMDEIADGSMDSDGLDDLIKIINSSENDNSNIFVISHNSKIIENFNNTIHFEMKNNFTQMDFSTEYK